MNKHFVFYINNNYKTVKRLFMILLQVQTIIDQFRFLFVFFNEKIFSAPKKKVWYPSYLSN
jgi:hypothetical protein